MTRPPDDDQRSFELLDDYLHRLQAGQAPPREAFVREHPELASALRCLEALEGLAPSAEPPGRPDEPGDAPPSAEELASVAAFLAEGGAPPQRDFGGYELLDELGRGGMGVVYRARQKTLDRVVALKMILSSHLASAEHVRRFQAEARAAARLRHPNIVPIHDVGQIHGQHYFTMECIEGQSLAARLAGAPLEPHRAADLVRTIARAVEHLHRHGVIHRDLKPSNILIDDEDQPYLTDFGLAKVFVGDTEATATGVVAGTPSYMSPEQAGGRHGEIGVGSDVYSLGAVLYEMLTGVPPFKADSLLDTLMLVLGSEPVAPRQVNPAAPMALELICLKCLAKAPAERYASAAELADDLDRYARGEAISVRPPSMWQRIARWSRREPALASRIGALSLFYVVEMVQFARGTVDAPFHAWMTGIVALWLVASVVCQQFLKSVRWASEAHFVWGTLDVAFLLAVLLLANGVASPLVIGYPLAIVGAGLWFRVRYVWYITVLSLLSYGLLMGDFYFRRTFLQEQFDTGVARHVIFMLGLLIIGGVVGHLVQRVRELSAFYERRNAPRQ